MADPQFPNRPARTTPNLGIPVPGDQDLADYVTGWGKVADETDTRVGKAVGDATAGFTQQLADAQTAFSGAITGAQNAALPLNLMLMGA